VKYPRIYAMLKGHHSAAKAAEIILDASRGDIYALRWIRLLRRRKWTLKDG